MTTEQKIKLEQAAESANGYNVYAIDTKGVAFNDGFLAGAQTILDNPGEWGLATKEDVMSKIRLLHEAENRWGSKVKDLESRLTKYREALERIASEVNPYIKSHENMWRIVFEALKQHDDEDMDNA